MDLKSIRNLINEAQNLEFDNDTTKTIILSLIEGMYGMIVELKEENQQLKDEVNRLKGEKGKHNIKPNVDNNKDTMEKPKSTKWEKKPKDVKIDREEIVKIDKAKLPSDAVFKGYSDKVIQGILITTDNVLYKREVYYSKSENKTYTASLNTGLNETSFSPELKTWIIKMYFEFRMSEILIHLFLEGIGISISEGEISNILIMDHQEEFTLEKENILITGIEYSEGHNIDDSGFKENGINKYINIICSPLFSYYTVNDNKKGETIKEMFETLNTKGKPLTCDDAPQWYKITDVLIQLCWVHEERHYKKLDPIFMSHMEELRLKREQIWDFYKALKAYKKNPDEKLKELLSKMFDKIFDVSSDYKALDKRLKLTYAKKKELLLVLDYPNIDIHNNLSENGIRPVVIKRKISNGTRTENGTIAWENQLSILSTCKKHNINYFDYILDIFNGNKNNQSLVDLIKQKSTIFS